MSYILHESPRSLKVVYKRSPKEADSDVQPLDQQAQLLAAFACDSRRKYDYFGKLRTKLSQKYRKRHYARPTWQIRPIGDSAQRTAFSSDTWEPKLCIEGEWSIIYHLLKIGRHG